MESKPMSEKPTPLTDAEAFMLDDGMGEAVMSDFARRLESALAVAEEALRYCAIEPGLLHPAMNSQPAVAMNALAQIEELRK